MVRYLSIYFSLFSLFLLLFFSPVLFLYRVGEYKGLDTVIEKQRNENGKIIYGTALHSNTQQYKKMLMKSAKPKIIALGSSRVMQFRQHMFLKDFVNLGGAVNSINEGIDIISDIAMNQPELIIFGIDIWWVNHAYKNPLIKKRKKENSNYHPKLSDTYKVINWLNTGKLSFTDIFEKTIKSAPDIGVRGQYKDGFGPDGSHYYTMIITGKKEHDDQSFKKTLRRIKNGNTKFNFSLKDSQSKLSSLVKIIHRLEISGTKTIVFFPPFASKVKNKLVKLDKYYEYVSYLKSYLKNNEITCYDYTDALLFGSTDCEFIDGIHGGEITYMRILNDILQKETSLTQYVDVAYLQRSIRLYSGKAFIPDRDITDLNEVDFLGMGCRK